MILEQKSEKSFAGDFVFLVCHLMACSLEITHIRNNKTHCRTVPWNRERIYALKTGV
jgi:hypothetical protein